MKRFIFPTLFIALLVHSCTYDILETEVPVDPIDTTSVNDTTDTTQTPLDTCLFATKIQPIISNYCLGCHGSGSGNGDFTTYGGIKSKVDDGSFEQEIITDKTMPQGGSLTTSELDVIQCWLDNGAQNN